MAMNDFNSGSEPIEDADSLSATGMFLSAFDSGSKPSPVQFGQPDPPMDVSFGGSSSGSSSGPATGPGSTRTDWPAPQFVPHLEAPTPTQSLPVPPKTGGAAAPGEFTQLFQSLEQKAATSGVSAVPPPVVQQPIAREESAAVATPANPTANPIANQSSTSSSGPGEFTRIFVSSSTTTPDLSAPEERAGGYSARTVVEAPQAPPPPINPARLKGFSTPGVSDSASAEGSFTQFFKATPSTPPTTPQPLPQAPQYAAPQPPPQVLTPTALPMPANTWQPDFGAVGQASDSISPNSSAGSATGLLSNLSSPSLSAPGVRQPEGNPYRPEPSQPGPLPSYTPAPPPAEPAAIEAGSVTRLIQRLSQVPKEAPPEPILDAAPLVAPPVAFSPAANAGGAAGVGPGEFTRMISGDWAKAATAPAQPPAGPTGTLAPAAPAFAIPVPQVTAPSVTPPAFHPPAAAAPPAAPRFEPPKMEVPKLASPALAAPKGKLEAMVPILLIVNTFLLVVLLLVVLFAMKAK